MKYFNILYCNFQRYKNKNIMHIKKMFILLSYSIFFSTFSNLALET